MKRIQLQQLLREGSGRWETGIEPALHYNVRLIASRLTIGLVISPGPGQALDARPQALGIGKKRDA